MLRKKEKEHKPEERKGFSPLQKEFFFPILIILNIYLVEISFQFQNSVFAEETQNTQAVEQKNIGSTEIKAKDSLQNLDTLEEKVLHQKFSNDSKEERIGRLEEFIFGTRTPNLSIESRINKLSAAIEPQKKEEKIKNEPVKIEPKQTEINNPIEDPKVIYDAPDSGVIGAISQIEMKVFNMTFNDIPFNKRVENVEDKILSKSEVYKARKKSLIERISILVKKSQLPVNQEKIPPTNPSNNQPQSYTIDPRTGYLINELTGEVVKDGSGNPVTVKIPRQLAIPQQPLPQPNYRYQQNPSSIPYGNNPLQPGGLPAPGQLPYDFLFNQGNFNLDPGADPGY
ncbi:MAG: hypothetical protein HY094_09765 [Candidatus Melainabacteria bacterium]|nr:hypothetical protein [Candidatus Melainabacteria bacterium]